MTFEQFKTYVKNLGKQPGCYSSEEAREICCMHKVCVDQNEKDWAAVAELLGSTSKEAARGKAKAYLARHPEYADTLKNQEWGNLRLTEEETQYASLYKQQVRTRDIVMEYRRLLREDARIDQLKAEIQAAARSLPTFVCPISYLKAQQASDVEAVLMLSDWHLGVIVDSFYNRYNLQIATVELDHLCEQVQQYCRNFNIHTLHILNMGDLIHGGIHTNARVEQEFDVITQIEVAGQLMYHVLSNLEHVAPVVTYRSCSDNHSRLMANKSEHIEKENFGRLIDWWLEAKLEQGKHTIKVIRDNLDFGLGKFTLVNGKKIMFAHGHEDNINQAYQNFTGATKEFIDYILLAHYHNPKEKAFQDCKVFVNGSLVGTEQYALSKRLFTSPTQKLLIFNEGDLIDISISVNTCRSAKI